MTRAFRTLVVLCFASLTVAAATLVAAQQTETKSQAGKQAAKVDFSYVTSEAASVVIAHPRRLMTAENLKALPVEVISASVKQELGIDPVDIETVLAIVEPPGPASPPGFGFVVLFSKAHDFDAVLPRLRAKTVEDKLGDRVYRRAKNPMEPSFIMPDNRTLLVATEGTLQKLLEKSAQRESSPLRQRLDKLQGDPDFRSLSVVEPVRDFMNGPLQNAPLPPGLEDVKKIPDLLSAVQFDLNLAGDFLVELTLFARDEQAAPVLERAVNSSIDGGKKLVSAQIHQQRQSNDPVQQAGLHYGLRMIDMLASALRPERKGDRLVVTVRDSSATQIGAIGGLVALLLPAVTQAREAARTAMSKNNLKQIGLAMHIYHDAKNSFPARANFDADGKPLLSWRVHILPYLDEQAFYDQFHLDEPWDSEHNKELIERMPEVYRNPNAEGVTQKTNYLLPIGENHLFDGDKAKRIRDVKDGTANTILAVEANDDQAVIWTKPDDLKVDPKQPDKGLGALRERGFLVLMADGSVNLIHDLDLEVLNALFTARGGEPIGDR